MNGASHNGRCTNHNPGDSAAAWSETLPRRGRVGILALILTESVFFSIFVVAYIFYLGKSLTGPYPRDVLSPPILNTICLLSSSITIVLAIRALRAGSIRTFAIWWFVTFALGARIPDRHGAGMASTSSTMRD